MRKLLVLVAVWVLSASLNAAQIELKGELIQGSLIRGQLPAGSLLWLNEQAIKVGKAGDFAFGFGRDAELTHLLSWQLPGEDKQSQALVLKKREYDIQHIDGLPENMVSPPQTVLDRIKQDNLQVAMARKADTEQVSFNQNFIWPAEGRISGVYGSQRVLNGEPKRPHFGVDVAAPIGTAVVAPADGIVTLFVPDMYYSGGTMIIDHGHGVSSTFIHLHKAHVKQGDVVTQGQLVAEIGATGRVTGPHLDWRINWFTERVDPALLVPAR